MSLTYKLECILRLNAEKLQEDIAIDLVRITLPEDLTDDQTKKLFDDLRENMKKKYQAQINEYFEVILKETK